MSEYHKRRAKMLTYYPQVASVGDLVTALSRALAAEGSSLTAYSEVQPEKPKWSIFSDHPDAPGTTVPEAAQVKTETRACQVWIGWFDVALGTYRVDFFESNDDDELADLDCWIDSTDLQVAARIIRGTFEYGAEVSELAREYGAGFGQRPRSKEEEVERELRNLSPEERDRELERRHVSAYLVIGVSESRVREVLSELDLDDLLDCEEQATLDLRDHIGKLHPGEGAPWNKAPMMRRILGKLRDGSADPERWANTKDDLKVREVLVDDVVQHVSAYWSHITEGHQPPPTESAEEYLISLTRPPRRTR